MRKFSVKAYISVHVSRHIGFLDSQLYLLTVKPITIYIMYNILRCLQVKVKIQLQQIQVLAFIKWIDNR